MKAVSVVRGGEVRERERGRRERGGGRRGGRSGLNGRGVRMAETFSTTSARGGCIAIKSCSGIAIWPPWLGSDQL